MHEKEEVCLVLTLKSWFADPSWEWEWDGSKEGMKEQSRKQGSSKGRERESKGVCCEWSKEWFADRNRSGVPQQNSRVRERGNMGGAMYTNSSFHHSHHTSETEWPAQEVQPVNDAGLFLAHCLCLMIKHRYLCVCMKQREKREGERWLSKLMWSIR